MGRTAIRQHASIASSDPPTGIGSCIVRSSYEVAGEFSPPAPHASTKKERSPGIHPKGDYPDAPHIENGRHPI
eukprot:9472560-Pyramimonas_sp.AAC.1